MVLLALVVVAVLTGAFLVRRLLRKRPELRPVVIGVVVVVVAAMALLLHRTWGDNASTGALTVTFGGSEGRPACVYDADAGTVEGRIVVEGAAPQDAVEVTVTAYADENTSDAVGSVTATFEARSGTDLSITDTLTIPVDRPPHVDEDGVAACRLSVER